jgi:hypothetical protein
MNENAHNKFQGGYSQNILHSSYDCLVDQLKIILQSSYDPVTIILQLSCDQRSSHNHLRII